MPKTYYIGDFDYSGIDVTFYKTSRDIAIGGWYDGCVGIEGERMSLRDFFGELGITLKDCERAFKETGE